MRIAIISYHTCPLATLGGKDTGGMNVYVRDLTRQLGKLGIQVDVFTRSQDEHVPHVLHDLGYGNRIVHVPAGPEIPLPKLDLVTYLPEFVRGIKEFADSKLLHYDLIHSHYWMSGMAAKEIKADWGVPMVHMFHTLGVMKQRVARSSEELEGDYRLNGEQEVINISDRIVAATPAELAQLQWLYKVANQKITVIPPGVDVSRFYPIPVDEAKEFIGIPPCERMLLFVGRIEPLKGLDVLIEAICLMKQAGRLIDKPFCLAIIGGTPEDSDVAQNEEMERLRALREHFGLQDLITFLGKRSQDTLPYYYSAAEVVVVPSQYESFGMVALEAMACGTPVVASQVGGLAFLIQNGINGFTVPVDDPRSLATCIENILDDDELCQKIGKQAFITAQNYSWERIANRIIALYQEVVDTWKS
jgi:D-inositol-3-phosphate glycosyltransferase